MPGTFEGPGQVGQGARQMYDFQDHSPTGVAFGPHLNVELFGAGVEFPVALGKQTGASDQSDSHSQLRTPLR